MKKAYFMILFNILLINLLFSPNCKKTKKETELNDSDLTSDTDKFMINETHKFIDEYTFEENIGNIEVYLSDNCVIYKEPDQISEVVLKNETVKKILSDCKHYRSDENFENINLWFRLLLENNNSGWAESKNIISVKKAEINNIFYGIIETAEIKFKGPDFMPLDTNLIHNQELVAFDDRKILKRISLDIPSDKITGLRLNRHLSDIFGLNLVQIDLNYNFAGDVPHNHQISYLYKTGEDGIIDNYIFYWWEYLKGQDLPDIALDKFQDYDKGLFLKYSFYNTYIEATAVASGTLSLYYDFDQNKKEFIRKKHESEVITKDNKKTELTEEYINKYLQIF